MCIVFMPYPPESQIRLPLLKSAKDKKVHSVLVVEKFLGDYFKLNSSEKTRIKKSGGERLFLHRIRWSRTNLKYAKLLEYPKPGFYKITFRGSKVLEKNPKHLDDSFLSQFIEFRTWRRRK